MQFSFFNLFSESSGNQTVAYIMWKHCLFLKDPDEENIW